MNKNIKYKNTTTDYGPNPYVTNIRRATLNNKYFRRALWTGEHLQLTLMCIKPNGEIGIERHKTVDQFLRIEQGEGYLFLGDSRNNLTTKTKICKNSAIFIPAGQWHNIVNTCRIPLKLYSIYAPVQHPYGTIHQTKEDADMDHHH